MTHCRRTAGCFSETRARLWRSGGSDTILLQRLGDLGARSEPLLRQVSIGVVTKEQQRARFQRRRDVREERAVGGRRHGGEHEPQMEYNDHEVLRRGHGA